MTKGKTCGDYVNSILAKREALLDGYDEAILLDSQGLVAEASGENVFVVRDGELRTPPLPTVLDGITRDVGDRARARQGHPGARGAHHPRRALRRRRGVPDRHRGRGHARSARSTTAASAAAGAARSPKALQEAFFAVVQGRDRKYERWLTYV